MLKYYTLLFLIKIIVTCYSTEESNVILNINDNSLNKLCYGLFPYIKEHISSITFPSCSFKERLPFLGNINFEIYDSQMLFNEISFDSFQTTIRQNDINLNIKNITAFIHFRYNFSSTFQNTSHEFGYTELTNLSIDTNFNFVRVQSKKFSDSYFPLITLKKLELNNFVSILNLSKTGKVGNTLKYLFSTISLALNGLINSQYKQIVFESINQTLKIVAETKLSPYIILKDYNLSIYYSINKDIIYFDNSIQIELISHVFNYDNQKSGVESINMINTISNDIEVNINSSIINDLLFSLHTNKLIKFELLNEKIPALNTKNFDFIKGIKERYYGDFPINLLIQSNKYYPNLILKKGIITGKINMLSDFFVVLSDDYSEKAFSLIFDINFTAFIYVANGILLGNIKEISIYSIEPVDSLIYIDYQSINIFFKSLIPELLDICNSVLSDKGIKIPHIGNLYFDELFVNIKEDYITIEIQPVIK